MSTATSISEEDFSDQIRGSFTVGKEREYLRS